MKRRSILRGLGAAALLPAATLHAATPVRTGAVTTVRMAVDEEPYVLWLAQSLGYLDQEGIQVERVALSQYVEAEYLVQQPLIKGQIDVAWYWFQHTVFGGRQGVPIRALMVFNDAPGMSVMVANRVKDRVRSAADFRGCNVAEGAGYGTKSLLNNLIAQRAGLPPRSYNAVMKAQQGRLPSVLQGLREGKVDVMTFQEPVTTSLMETGLVSQLYDMTTAQATTKVLGAPWLSQSLLAAPELTRSKPEVLQRLVNALVRTMRYVNAHDGDAIARALPAAYYQGKNRAEETAVVKSTLGSHARGSYAIDPVAARLAMDAVQGFAFDESVEGQWRAGGTPIKDASTLYDNHFVERAMKQYA